MYNRIRNSLNLEIIKDRWGVSHIYAKSEGDLFFAQGYNVARELEMWRRQATGTVAEILEPQEVARDLGNRLFLFRGGTGWFRAVVSHIPDFL